METIRRRLAGMNCHYIHYTFDYFLDQMEKLEIENIELWGAAPHFYVEDETAVGAALIRRKIEARNLNLICFTPEQVTYPINIAAREQDLRRKSVNYYLKAGELCRELGTDRMLITPGWGYLDEPSEEAWKRSVDSVEKVVKLAEKEGITLLLEHLSPISSNLINLAQDLKRMLEAVPSPNLRAMADTVQISLAQEKMETYFDVLGNSLQHLHFADGNPGGHLALGDGILPLKKELDVIEDRGYSGYLTMEIADRRYFKEPELADSCSLKQFYQYVERKGEG